MNNVLRVIIPVFFLSLMFVQTARGVESISADLTINRIYDNNLFRLADNINPQTVIGASQLNDVIKRAGVQLNLDLPLSLQKVIGHAGVVATRFERNTQLDNNGLDLMLGWAGELGEIWGGNVQWNRKRTLANFANFQSNQRNILTHDRVEAGIRHQISTRWLMWGDWKQDAYSRSLVSEQRNDRRTINLRMGMTGRSSAGSELKFFASSRTVDFVNLTWTPGALQDDELREDELKVRLKWNITSTITADGGVGVERVINPNLPQNDFSGNSYDMALVWNDNGVWNWQTAIWRNIDTVESIYGNYVVRKGARLTALWAVRATLLIRTKISTEWLNYEAGSAANREDVLRNGSISLLYKPLRNTELNLTYTRNNRDSTIPFGNFLNYSIQMGASIRWQ